MLSTSTYRSVFAGTALAIAGSGAFAAEPLLSTTESAVISKAICKHLNIPLDTKDQVKSCEETFLARKNSLTENELAAGVRGACYSRHRGAHVSFYEACREDLYAQYELPADKPAVKIASAKQISAKPAAKPLPQVDIPAKPNPAKTPEQEEANHLAACVEGVVVSTGAVFVVHAGAAVLDVLGCMGLCSAFAWSSTPTMLGAGAAGCAGGVIKEQIRINRKNAPVYNN